jgi:hypothetical protein
MRYEYLNESNWIKSNDEIFFLEGYRSKLIRKGLVCIFQENAISLSKIKNWLRQFKFGVLFCGDEERPRTPQISLDRTLQCFLKKFPFVNVRVMTGNFSVDWFTIKSIFDRELGLRKFTRRWVPISYQPNRNWKSDGIPKSIDHPNKYCGEKLSANHYRRWILVRLFDRIQRNVRFLLCWHDPKGSIINFVEKSHDYTFFTANNRLILDALRKGSKYNQKYFMNNLFPALNQIRTENDHHEVASTLMVYMDHSMSLWSKDHRKNMVQWIGTSTPSSPFIKY